MMTTAAWDFASAGAPAAIKGKTSSRFGAPQLVKTVARASESVEDSHKFSKGEKITMAPAVHPVSLDSVGPTPEQRAYDTVNFVLQTLGNRLGEAGLVSLPSLDRALTSATAAVLFSAEASPLFESLRTQAHDLVLVNSVFCAIYFIGFVSARLASTLPHYKSTYVPLGTKVIQQLFHAAIGEDATQANLQENLSAYRTLSTATGLLQPTNSGPGIFPGFPVLKRSQFSPTGFMATRENKSSIEKLTQHWTKNGFPQPVVGSSTPGHSERGRSPPEPIHIIDWRFLTGDDNSRSFEVMQSDKHIGENFGRVIFWLICSAHRLLPGQAVIVYHQQHIQLVRWLGNRFGYRVLTVAEDLDWNGKHFDLNPKLKSIMREWLVIVPGPSEKRSSMIKPKVTISQRTQSEKRTSPTSSRAKCQERVRAKEAEDVSKPITANSKEVRRPSTARHGRSVSFATDRSLEPLKPSRSATSPACAQAHRPFLRVRTEPLRSAIKAIAKPASTSPPRPPRPEEKDIPDLFKMNEDIRHGFPRAEEAIKTTPDDSKQPAPQSSTPNGPNRILTISTAIDYSEKTKTHMVSPNQLSPGAGLPPFVSDMSNRSSSENSPGWLSRSYSNGSQLPEQPKADQLPPSPRALATVLAQTSQGTDKIISEVSGEFTALPEKLSSLSQQNEFAGLPGAMDLMQKNTGPAVQGVISADAPPKIPTKSPRRVSPTDSPSAENPPADPRHSSKSPTPATAAQQSLAVTLKSHPTTLNAKASSQDNMLSFKGISDTHIASRRPSLELIKPSTYPSSEALGYFAAVQSQGDQAAKTIPATTEIKDYIHRATSSTDSATYTAPSWPSSVASVPSSIPDAPARSQSDFLSTVDTPTSHHTSASTRRKAPPPPRKIPQAIALYDFEATDPAEEVSFREGDKLYVVERSKELEDDGWCRARMNDMVGLVPLAYIEILTSGAVAGSTKSTASEDESPSTLALKK